MVVPARQHRAGTAGLRRSFRPRPLRWFVVPGIAGSGLAMLFAAPLRRLEKQIIERSARDRLAIQADRR